MITAEQREQHTAALEGEEIAFLLLEAFGGLISRWEEGEEGKEDGT